MMSKKKFIIPIVIGVLLFAICCIASGVSGALAGAVLAYVAIAFGTQVCYEGCLVEEVFFDAWHKTIDMPGIIFSFDIDGCLFMLAYKFIIAPIAMILLTVVFGILGTLLAALLSLVTFPFNIFRMVRDYFG